MDNSSARCRYAGKAGFRGKGTTLHETAGLAKATDVEGAPCDILDACLKFTHGEIAWGETRPGSFASWRATRPQLGGG